MNDLRTRNEPPPFRPVEVVRVGQRSPHLVRVTLTGSALAGFDGGLPAASVRLLLPPDGADGPLELPTWQGNEFLLGDGRRARIRTLTPLRFDPERLELDVEVVLHGEAPLSTWARTAEPGTPSAVSGTGRGYDVDPGAPAYLVVGDESALPAIATLLPALPPAAEVTVLVEARHPDAEIDLPPHPQADVRWQVLDDGAPAGDAMVAAVEATPIAGGTRVWAAGEAAAVQRIRKHLAALEHPRDLATVRGYWKHGRAGT